MLDHGYEQLLRRTYGHNPADVTDPLGSPGPHANASRSMLDRLPIHSQAHRRSTRKPTLSNDVAMSASNKRERKSSSRPESQGVFSNLPHTRPQRSSARRTAARDAMAAAAAAAAGSAPVRSNGHPAPTRSQARAQDAKGARGGRRPAKARSASGRQRPRSASSRTAAKGTEAVPRQGFECGNDRVHGSVQPPGGAELVASAAEIIGELAKAGLSTGERVLKDVLSRLPLS